MSINALYTLLAVLAVWLLINHIRKSKIKQPPSSGVSGNQPDDMTPRSKD